MGSAAGGGAAFTIASGNFQPQAIVNSALLLGLISGGFYKVSEAFKSEYTDQDFERGSYLLTNLGLKKYSKNLRRAHLTDQTIMLWNESALQEARIPAGPRLRILYQIDQYRKQGKTGNIMKKKMNSSPVSNLSSSNISADESSPNLTSSPTTNPPKIDV